MDTSAYRLSRIYGEGWNAAKKSLLHRAEGLRTKPPSTENPHEMPEERARWNKGFEDGLRSRTGAHTSSNLPSWPLVHNRTAIKR